MEVSYRKMTERKVRKILEEVSILKEYKDEVDKIVKEYFSERRFKSLRYNVACVSYLVLRREGHIILFYDHAERFGCDPNRLWRYCRNFSPEGKVPFLTPEEAFELGRARLNLSEEAKKASLKCYYDNEEVWRKYGFLLRARYGACIYLGSRKVGERRTLKEVGSTFRLGVSTLHTAVKILESYGKI